MRLFCNSASSLPEVLECLRELQRPFANASLCGRCLTSFSPLSLSIAGYVSLASVTTAAHHSWLWDGFL